MRSIGFGLENIGIAALKRPVLATVLVVLVTIISLVGVRQISFSSGLADVFKTQRAEYIAFKDYRDKFSRSEHDIFILLEGKNLATPKAVTALRNLVLDAGLIDGIQGVISIFSLRRAPLGDGQPERIVPAELPDQAGLRNLFSEIDIHPLSQGKLISKDRRNGAIILVRKPEFEHAKDYKRIAAELAPLIDEAARNGGIRLTVSGLPTVRVEMINQLIKDQFILNSMGALLGLILATLVWRSLRYALITIIPSIIALFWVLGTLGLTGAGINIMTNVLPVLVLIIAFADGMHLTYHWRQNRLKHNGDVRERITQMVKEIGPACALTSVTTAIAFAALITVDSPLVQSFGKAGVIGMIGAFASVIVIHPLLIYWAHRFGWLEFDNDREQTNAIPVRAITRLCDLAVKVSMKFAKPIAIFGLALTVLAGAAHLKIESAYSYLENIPEQSVGFKALKIIDSKLGGTTTLNLTLTLPDDISPLSASGLSAIGRVHEAVAKTMPNRQVYSLWSLALWMGVEDMSRTARQVAKQIKKLPPAARKRFMSPSGNTTMVSIYLRDEGAPATRKYTAQIEAAAKKALAQNDIKVSVTGLMALSASLTDWMITRLSWSLVIAAFCSIIIIGIAFRKWQLALMAFVPNLLPIFIVEAVLMATGKGLQITSVIALTVALGIALDDTIHFLNRLVHEANGKVPGANEVAKAIRGVGPVLIATTMVLCAGMVLTMTSTLPMIELFGQLTILVLITALLADLILLPALVLVFGRKGGK